jgi:hypothetical protein
MGLFPFGFLFYIVSDCSWGNFKNKICETKSSKLTLLDIILIILFWSFMLGGYLMSKVYDVLIYIGHKLNNIKLH